MMGETRNVEFMPVVAVCAFLFASSLVVIFSHGITIM
jgi:hypothetical protein